MWTLKVEEVTKIHIYYYTIVYFEKLGGAGSPCPPPSAVKYINPGISISDLLFNPDFCVLGVPTPGAAYLRATTRYISRWT